MKMNIYLLGYNIPFKERNPHFLESRLNHSSLLLSFSPRLPPAPFACAAGDVNSGRVCLHFHCLASVCGLLVVIVVVTAATVVDVDVDDIPRVRKSEMKKRREDVRGRTKVVKSLLMRAKMRVHF